MTNNIHTDRILILDFGAQYTQLIAPRIREVGVYCEIYPWDVSEQDVIDFGAKGIILSGGPESTIAENAPVAPSCVYELGSCRSSRVWLCSSACAWTYAFV